MARAVTGTVNRSGGVARPGAPGARHALRGDPASPTPPRRRAPLGALAALVAWCRRGRSFAAATGWLAVAQMIGRAQSAVILVVTSRVLVESEFAAFLTVQSVVLLGATVWDLGTT